MTARIQILDTHTAGEPTRVVIDGGPDLGTGPLSERREVFRTDFDRYRSAIVNEPRGSDVMVGALLVEPTDPTCTTGVIFFNNVGFLGMCGHGTMGVVVALGQLGKITAGQHRIETPVGVVTVQYDGKNRVAVENVPSYRVCGEIVFDVPGLGRVWGEAAWGGNWFFLIDEIEFIRDRRGGLLPPLQLNHAAELAAIAQEIRSFLPEAGIRTRDGAEIDHIEIFGRPCNQNNHRRNFVLCPGGAYDRSPCGTGTSAKIACLAANGKLQPGEIWRQEGILGSVFEASYRWNDDKSAVIPTITGSAYVTAESNLIFDPDDPFVWGIPH